MALQRGSDFVQTLCGQMPEELEKPGSGHGPDLLAKRLAFAIQPSFSSRDPDLERKDAICLHEIGISVTVGLDRFARSFCSTIAGRVLPTSDPTTGSNWTR